MLEQLSCDKLAEAVSDRLTLEDPPIGLALVKTDVLLVMPVLLGLAVLICMPEAQGVSTPLLLAVDCRRVVLADRGAIMEVGVLGPGAILAEGLLLGVRIRITTHSTWPTTPRNRKGAKMNDLCTLNERQGCVGEIARTL